MKKARRYAWLASYASVNAFASWSPQDVPRPLQEIPLMRLTTSSTVMP